ncbi:MAG: EAL domain-containing protein [Hahellaceae bacterium]|nr:EAL domain-containing protein [Hahellaceae bacterium]
MSDNDLLVFMDEPEESSNVPGKMEKPWKVLIVDDEEQIHAATRFALKGVVFADRGLDIVSAYSAAEALSVLQADGDYACIFLDVVMESEQAGLNLVPRIRDELHNESVRIILRTGQPGYAPEMEVIQRYDINDYKAKSELTRDKLLTTLITALRSYQQLKAIEASREGLELILDASTRLFSVRYVSQFALGALKQICGLLQTPTEGILCAHFADQSRDQLKVLAASGRFMGLQGRFLSDLEAREAAAEINEAIRAKESRFNEASTVLYILSPMGDELAVYVDCRNHLTELDKKMIRLFSVNVAVGFENAHLFEHVERLAYIDQLTQLPNRIAFNREIGRLTAVGEPFAVVIADIDNFQSVNDGLGHDIGDITLNLAGRLINRLFGGKHFVARVSSDSFGILLPVRSSETLLGYMEEFARINETTLQVQGNQIPLSVTFGVALFPTHERTPEGLFKCAGIALKNSKAVRRGSYKVFDSGMEKRLKHRLSLICELRQADMDAQFDLLYQPVINLETGAIEACEALIRWTRDNRLVMPTEFIPAAEESGQIIPIGEWVLRKATMQLKAWLDKGLRLRMAINVSTRQLRDPGFLQVLQQVLARYDVPANLIELEITESFLIEDLPHAQNRLFEIRDLGVGLAIDDFGTGYSSLSYLHELPVSRLKIDRSFVARIQERSEDRTICDLILQTGRLLGMRILAEGVETESQVELLRNLGCHEAQGFLFSPAVSADTFEHLL